MRVFYGIPMFSNKRRQTRPFRDTDPKAWFHQGGRYTTPSVQVVVPYGLLTF